MASFLCCVCPPFLVFLFNLCIHDAPCSSFSVGNFSPSGQQRLHLLLATPLAVPDAAVEVCDEIAFVVDSLGGTLRVGVHDALGYQSEFGQYRTVPSVILLASEEKKKRRGKGERLTAQCVPTRAPRPFGNYSCGIKDRTTSPRKTWPTPRISAPCFHPPNPHCLDSERNQCGRL